MYDTIVFSKLNRLFTILDKELPQMGYKQWLDTYCTKLLGDNSPALIDMIGSIRSKVYSICKIIERDGERYEMAKERYKVLHASLSVEDRVSCTKIFIEFSYLATNI